MAPGRMNLARLSVACGILLAVAGTFGAFTPMTAQDGGNEPTARFTAAALLPAAMAQGPHHRVADDVRTEGYFHAFTLSSTYGPFEALGITELAVRIQEIGALAALDDVSKTEVFAAAAGQSVLRIGQSTAAVVTDPVGTAKGIGAGVKRLGVNLGRRTKRAVDSTGADQEAAESNTASAAGSVLGVNAAMRRWAQKVGADPYTTNPVLRQALTDVAKIDVAGSIATKVVVPIPAPVGTMSSVGDLVWSKDPEEVRKLNEQRLRAVKVPNDVAAALFRSRWFTLTAQTRLVTALAAVNITGVAEYVRTASEAASAREALFFVESAEMLAGAHARQPAAAILPDSRALVTRDADGRIRAFLPLDWIAWTAETQAAIGELTGRARQELKGRRLEIILTGRASERALRELGSLGWQVAFARPTADAREVL